MVIPKQNIEKITLKGVLDFDLLPFHGHGPWGPGSWSKCKPSRVTMVQI